ncbi:MAG: PDR/VanB family oxidoreductase [Leucobacter sp.]
MPTATNENPPADSAPAGKASAGGAPAGFVTAQILDRTALTPAVEQFQLRVAASEGAESGPGFEAGSHLELLLPLGGDETDGTQPGDAQEVRHYSICTAEDGCFTIAVLREDEGRGGSLWMHERAAVGGEVLVRGPRNTFPFKPEGAVYFIAGGIGITPFLSMIAEAEQRGIDWHLLYLGRSGESMAFADELLAHGDRVTLWPSAERGRADLGETIAKLPHDTLIYACGPNTMQQALRTASAETGHVIVIEDFDSGKVADPEAAAGSAEAGGSEYARPSLPFTVELGDGTEIDVPADKTILDALNDAGMRALSSCRRGTCGTCETVILEGEADHRDSVLSDEEKEANEVMMICVSRACGDRIVLDL